MENYDELFDLLVKFTDTNISSVIDWVLHYNHKAELQVIADPLVCKMDKLYEMVSKKNKEMSIFKHLSYAIEDYFLSEIQQNIDEDNKEILYKYISSKSYTLLMEKIKEIKGHMNNENEIIEKYNGYKEKYLVDTELLIEDIISILKLEYSNRVIETKIAITNYIEPHKLTLDNLNSDIEKVEKAISDLKKDETLMKDDVMMLMESLNEKNKSMIDIRKREIENIKNVKAFIEEIRHAKNKFDSMIKLLESKNIQAKTRKQYISLIKSIDAKIPYFNDLFIDLSNELKKDMQNISDAFFLLNSSIKLNLINSIDNQESIIQILGINRDSIIENINDNFIKLNKDLINNDYKISLDFLDT